MDKRDKIEYFSTEEEAIIQSALKKKQERIFYQQSLEKKFVTRTTAIEAYYYRISADSKVKLLQRLINEMKSLSSILQILHILSSWTFKVIAYAAVDPNTNYVLDKLVLDHNRMLDDATLEETIDNDVQWFSTLNGESQVVIVVDLLRIAGGVVKRNMYIPVWRRYHYLLNSTDEVRAFQSNQGEELVCQMDWMSNEDGIDFDPKHPASIEVEKQRKKWEDMMEKYRSEVTNITKKLLMSGSDKAKKDVENNTAQLTKKNKEGKKGKNEKSSKKSKKDLKDGKDDINAIELMPLWIVKKIFGFLDEKTLRNCKKAGKYFAYVVQEMQKEAKARAKLDKAIKAMKETIDPDIIKDVVNDRQRKLEQLPKITRNVMHYELGAISPELRPTFEDKLMETSLLEKATKELPDEYGANKALVTFPRLLNTDMELYRFKSCFLKDINVRFVTDDELQRQKSMLTYSLTSIASSLKFSIDESLLEDW